MNAITVNDLHKACEILMHKGEGTKKILISGDDEGNSFHELFYAFTSTKGFEFDKPWMRGTLPFGVTPEQAESDYIVLG